MDYKLERAIEKFDIHQFLDENDITYEMGGDNIGVDWIGISPCINCEDEDFHFGMNINTKTTHCWKCGSGADLNLIGFVAKVKQISYKKAKEFIIEETMVDEESNLEDRILEILGSDERTTTSIVKEEEIKLEGCVDLTYKLVKKHEYLNRFFIERKLTRNHIFEYDLKLGVSGRLKGKIIFPIFHKKRLVAYQARSLFESNYVITGPAHSYLLKIEEIPKNSKIIIVEGFLDRIRIEDFVCKFYKNKYYTTTPFSKILSDLQVSLLNKLKPKESIYMLDNDAWFDYKKTCDKLNHPSSFVVLPKNKDPGSMDEKENLKFFKENNL